MLTYFARIVLSSVSIAPFCIAYAIISLIQGGYIMSFLAIFLAIISLASHIALLKYAGKTSESLPFSVSDHCGSGHGWGVCFLALVTAFIAAVVFPAGWPSFIPAMIVFYALVSFVYRDHINPIFGLPFWRVYKVRSSSGAIFGLITRRAPGEVLSVDKVGRLTPYILIDKRCVGSLRGKNPEWMNAIRSRGSFLLTRIYENSIAVYM